MTRLRLPRPDFTVRAQRLAGPAAVIVVFSLIPVTQNYENRAWFSHIGPFDFYAYLIQHGSVLPLVLPLAASLPYALSFSSQLSHRFLAYTRVRANIRVTLSRRLARNAVTTFTTFFLVGLIPQVFVVLGGTRYTPQSYGLESPAEISTALQHLKTFSQLLIYGEWAPVLAYSGWLATNATLYSTLIMCTLVLIQNRALGLSIPWIMYLLASLLLAILWLESYSIALVFPFNLTQLSLWNLCYPLIGLILLNTLTIGYLLIRAPALQQLL